MLWGVCESVCWEEAILESDGQGILAAVHLADESGQGDVDISCLFEAAPAVIHFHDWVIQYLQC